MGTSATLSIICEHWPSFCMAGSETGEACLICLHLKVSRWCNSCCLLEADIIFLPWITSRREIALSMDSVWMAELNLNLLGLQKQLIQAAKWSLLVLLLHLKLIKGIVHQGTDCIISLLHCSNSFNRVLHPRFQWHISTPTSWSQIRHRWLCLHITESSHHPFFCPEDSICFVFYSNGGGAECLKMNVSYEFHMPKSRPGELSSELESSLWSKAENAGVGRRTEKYLEKDMTHPEEQEVVSSSWLVKADLKWNQDSQLCNRSALQSVN